MWWPEPIVVAVIVLWIAHFILMRTVRKVFQEQQEINEILRHKISDLQYQMYTRETEIRLEYLKDYYE